jgi:putative cardiolipin synthase
LLEAALRAAQRGVRVRLLVDDLNVGESEADLAMLAGHLNVEVRLFNPFSQRGGFGLAQVLELIGDGDRLNRRMHNKLWIADGAVAVMGGRNLGDTYFDASGEADFADLDVLVAGPVVGDVSRSFDQYWNSEWAVPITWIAGPAASAVDLQRAWSGLAERAERVRQSDYVRALRETAFGLLVRNGQVPLILAPAEVLSDPPGDPQAGEDGTKGMIFPALRQVVERARQDVILVTPYLVPSGRGLDALCGLTRRGVRVRILTNSLASTDVTAVHAGYARYRPRMLACGIQLHELRPKGLRAEGRRVGLASGVSLHTKAIVVDGESVFVGSMNLDPRSRTLNSEVALRIDSEELGMQLRALFDEATTLEESFRVELDEPGDAAASLHWKGIEDGRPIRYVREPLTSTWRRWSARVLGALTPEDLL